MTFSFNTLIQKYKTMPRVVRKLLFPLSWAYYFLKEMYALLRPCVWLIRSSADQNNESVGLMFCGGVHEKNYMVRTIFSGNCTQTGLGRPWIWQIKRITQKHERDIDLLLQDVPRWFSLWPGRRKCLCIPVWVQGDLDFSLINFHSKTIKTAIQKVRQHNYTFEITRDREQLYRFYNEMYVPHVLKRYGEEFSLVSFEDLLKESNNMEVLFVKKGETPVSGICYYYDKDNVVIRRYVGVAAGDENLIKSGAVQAINYFFCTHFKDKQPKRISHGGARPFFGDGVLVYKKKWGLRLTHCKHNVLRLHLLRDTRAVRAFLVRNPFIAVEGKELIGVVFLDRENTAVKEEIKTSYLWPGLKRVVVYPFGDHSSVACESMQEDAVIVRPARELLEKSGGNAA